MVANIDNNVKALVVVGVGGLVVVTLIGLATGELQRALRRSAWGTRVGLLGAVAIVFGTWATYVWWDGFYTKAHSTAAIGMFVFLAVVVVINAWKHWDSKDLFFWIYAVIAALMVGAAAVIAAVAASWDHAVLVLEAVEIALFAAFWIVQTIEDWRTTPGVSGSGGETSRAVSDLR